MSVLFGMVTNVLLAGLLAMTALFVQRRLARPKLARILWLLVLVKLLVAPLFSWQSYSSSAITCWLGLCSCGPHADSFGGHTQAIVRVMFAVWGAGIGISATVAWMRWRHFQVLVQKALPAPQPWQADTERLSFELGLWHMPDVLTVPGRIPPLVIPGCGRPRLLIASALAEHVSPVMRSALLTHELTHLRRLDHWTRLIELMVSVMYWWLPLIGWMGRRLRECEEQVCDNEVVLRLPAARRDYARLLLDVLDFSTGHMSYCVPPTTHLSAADGLEQRLQFILGNTPPRPAAQFMSYVSILVAVILTPCQFSTIWKFRGPQSELTSAIKQPSAGRPEPSPTSAISKIDWEQIPVLSCSK